MNLFVDRDGIFLYIFNEINPTTSFGKIIIICSMLCYKINTTNYIGTVKYRCRVN